MPGRERHQEGFGFQSQVVRLPVSGWQAGLSAETLAPGAAGEVSTGRKLWRNSSGPQEYPSCKEAHSETWSGTCHPTPTLRHWWVLGLGFLICEMEPPEPCSASQGHRAELTWAGSLSLWWAFPGQLRGFSGPCPRGLLAPTPRLVSMAGVGLLEGVS